MMEYTGHPFVDIGLATILAHSGKQSITELTPEDLDRFADYIEQHYFSNPIKAMLSYIAFPNSAYTQPNLKAETKQQFIDLVIRGYRADNSKLQEQCVFTKKPAVLRIYREHFPLLASISVNNFYANGKSGLPVSGEVALALQALPLGGRLCGGRSLVVHSNNIELMQDFTKSFLEDNKVQVSLVEVSTTPEKEKRLQGVGSPKTVLIEALLQVERGRQFSVSENEPASVTAYWFKNHGQDAAIEIFHLPFQVLRFVILVDSFYHGTWGEISRRAHALVGQKKIPKNFLYEDLFSLPNEAHRFVRTYFLRQPTRREGKDSPLSQYSLEGELHLISWGLVELFLEEIMDLDKARIEAVRQMGDVLANYHREVDSRILNRLFRARYFRELSYELAQAKKTASARGRQLFTFDQFIEVFAESEGVPRLDWSLARDLVVIRMFDQLTDVLSDNKEELEELTRDVPALD